MLRVCSPSFRHLVVDVAARSQCYHLSLSCVRLLRVSAKVAIRTPATRNSTLWTIHRGSIPTLPNAGLSTLSEEEIRRKMEHFNDLFVTAREEMEYAGESKETTYFDEEAAAAKEAVEEAVALFESVLREVSEEKRRDILRGSGLRVEQLKAELDELLASDDH